MDDEKIQEELQFLLEEDSRVVSLWRVRFSFFQLYDLQPWIFLFVCSFIVYDK